MDSTNKRKIAFLTGTRADFGKLKPILSKLEENDSFQVYLFVTGMHLLKKYDYTYIEIENCNYKNVYKFINQNEQDSMDHILAKTISGFSDYIREFNPDMICIHGDRIEALAAAIVGSLNNILVGHIEGGEVSGTVDELLRHSISKLSHYHFVSNNEARNRLVQMGEMEQRIFVTGSPETDIMNSSSLPCIHEVQRYYNIDFDDYGILIFHPVTTELDQIGIYIKNLLDILIDETDRNFVVIHPNNDSGAEIILEEYNRLNRRKRFRVFTSLRFEYYLSLMKHAQFLIGNSSSGVRETPYFGVPSINIGSRQFMRNNAPTIINCDNSKFGIKKALDRVNNVKFEATTNFGNGNCSEKVETILSKKEIWDCDGQKYFVDIK